MEDETFASLASLDYQETIGLNLKGLRLIVMKPSTYEALLKAANAASKPVKPQ
jgi:hypothetical protein